MIKDAPYISLDSLGFDLAMNELFDSGFNNGEQLNVNLEVKLITPSRNLRLLGKQQSIYYCGPRNEDFDWNLQSEDVANSRVVRISWDAEQGQASGTKSRSNLILKRTGTNGSDTVYAVVNTPTGQPVGHPDSYQNITWVTNRSDASVFEPGWPRWLKDELAFYTPDDAANSWRCNSAFYSQVITCPAPTTPGEMGLNGEQSVELEAREVQINGNIQNPWIVDGRYIPTASEGTFGDYVFVSWENVRDKSTTRPFQIGNCRAGCTIR